MLKHFHFALPYTCNDILFFSPLSVDVWWLDIIVFNDLMTLSMLGKFSADYFFIFLVLI